MHSALTYDVMESYLNRDIHVGARSPNTFFHDLVSSKVTQILSGQSMLVSQSEVVILSNT